MTAVAPAGSLAESQPGPILEAIGLTKRYPGTIALRGFDFTLQAGEVRALLGKNGAGKSTFVEILSGSIRSDIGHLRINGQAANLISPLAAQQAGISTVHQELLLFPDLTVRENITINRCAEHGFVSQRRQDSIAREALSQIGVAVDLDARVGSLSARDQQLVAIAKALSFHPRVLILDEPTSALASGEIDQLLALVRRLAASGVAVVYVSHRLDEIPRVADSVTVLRDGELVSTLPIAQATSRQIVEAMLGRALLQAEPLVSTATDEVRLELRDVSAGTRVLGISLVARRGEIVGLWGMPGAGRTELLRAVFGMDPLEGGSILVDGQSARSGDLMSQIRRGVGFSPEDRQRDGLVMVLSIAENLVMACPERVSRNGVRSFEAIARVAREAVQRMAIKAPTTQMPVGQLSGGNQQKVVVGKWLAAGVRILLLDEPTKGIDVEAKASLYRLLREFAGQGVTVLIAPTELEELFRVSDRVLVLQRGRVVADVAAASTTPATVMSLAMGVAG